MARERPIGPDQHTTNRAYGLRDRVDLVHPFRRLLLVRDSQIANRESEERVQRAECRVEARGRDRRGTNVPARLCRWNQ